MNHPEAFRVYRTPEGQPHRLKRWRPLRKGVADLPRRAQICRAANDRYVAALATVPTDEPAGKLARPVCQPIVRRGRRHRALNPWGEPDATLLRTIARGEWAVNGFRNRDLCAALYKKPGEQTERHRQSGRVTDRRRPQALPFTIRTLSKHAGVLPRHSRNFQAAGFFASGGNR